MQSVLRFVLCCILLFLMVPSVNSADLKKEFRGEVAIIGARAALTCSRVKLANVQVSNGTLALVLDRIEKSLHETYTLNPTEKVQLKIEAGTNVSASVSLEKFDDITLLELLILLAEQTDTRIEFTDLTIHISPKK